MHYSLFHGVYTPLSDKLARTGGTLLPFGAILVLTLAFGTSTIYQAAGKHPSLPVTKPAVSAKAIAAHNSSSPSQNSTPTASGSNSTGSVTPTSTSNQYASTSVPTSGGFGGGTTSTSPTSSTTTTSTSSSGLPPSGTTTATVPGQDVTVGSKTIISTSPLSLTVN